MYIPSPINTENVELNEELKEIVELLAKNVHDSWAVGRIREGWKYGLERNDQAKETPCLVSYDELPENEKEYDRITSLETVKAIIRLGYEIKKSNS